MFENMIFVKIVELGELPVERCVPKGTSISNIISQYSVSPNNEYDVRRVGENHYLHPHTRIKEDTIFVFVKRIERFSPERLPVYASLSENPVDGFIAPAFTHCTNCGAPLKPTISSCEYCGSYIYLPRRSGYESYNRI